MQSAGPDNDTFTTPPSTPSMIVHRNLPNATLASLSPSLTRKNSRPSSLRIHSSAAVDWLPDVVVSGSPDIASPPNGTSPNMLKATQKSPPAGSSPTPRSTPVVPTAARVQSMSPQIASSVVIVPQPAGEAPPPYPQHEKAINSPCFVHSQLDNGASFADWLRGSPETTGSGPKSPHIHINGGNGAMSDYTSSPDEEVFERDEDSDEAYGHASLTKKLADTAVGVREMSKQLGRARIHSHIQSVLIVTKAKDNRLIKLTREIALYLMTRPRKGLPRGLVVYVDNQLRNSRRFDAAGIERDHPELFVPLPRRRASSSTFSTSSSSSSLNGVSNGEYPPDAGQLRYWTAEMCSRSPHLFDFVVTLGGDGTVLFTSWLFQRIVPPVLPFALGSLGFLTNFDFADHQAAVDRALDDGIRVNLRMRFTCTVYRANMPGQHARKGSKRMKAIKKADTGEIMMRDVERGGWEAIEGGMPDGMGTCSKDKEIMCFTSRPAESFEILNDLVVDRGPSPYVSQLELFADEHHLTTVQADGLCVATPTGSTAYSLSAGGSLVHPEIPSILITPLCPHTLSFRPMLLPDSMELRICVPFNSRSTAWASFDGRGRVELKQGDHIKVTASKYPFPTVCADRSSTDWFQSISRTLKWNERERQKSFVVVEENPTKKRIRQTARAPVPTADTMEELVDNDEEDECSDEDEDEGFDIDVVDDTTTAKATKSVVTMPRDTLLQPHEHRLGKEKVRENLRSAPREQARAEAAALALARGTQIGSGAQRSGLHSGIDSPDRFITAQPHAPPSARHVAFAERALSPSPRHPGHPQPSPLSLRETQPERESLKTPTGARATRHSRSRSREPRQHVPPPTATRAFAVYGQDESESESNASGDEIS